MTTNIEQPPLESLLADLDRQQLLALILSLAGQDQELVARITGLARGLTTAGVAAPQTPARRIFPAVDADELRRQVRRGLRNAVGSWDDYHDEESPSSAIAGAIRANVDDAQERTAAGDGAGALELLECITAEAMEARNDREYWDDEEDDYEHLINAWTEALLTAHLSKAERRRWTKKLGEWNGSGDGDEDEDKRLFAAPIAAARQGWDDPGLVRVLQGQIQPAQEGEQALPRAQLQLVAARLNVLERYGRFQEYLYVAEANGQTLPYLMMLVRLDRIAEAVAFTRDRITDLRIIELVARALHERGRTDEAITVASHGLAIQETNWAPDAWPRLYTAGDLSLWLRDVAAEVGKEDLAVRAGRMLFRVSENLEAYRWLQEHAGQQWPAVRDELLQQLRRKRDSVPAGAVDVFLHEGLIDDALKAVKSSRPGAMEEKVVDAALSTRAEVVIPICRNYADQIMDAARPDHYAEAAQWVRRLRDACRTAGREDEWTAYYDEIGEKHGRKRNLMPLIRALKT